MHFIIIGIVLFIVGLIFGFAWPKKSWRWGLRICSPAIILIGFSLVFAGNLTAFLKYDLPILLVGLIAASSGSFIGAWLKRRRLHT
jgi:hypothetical protein